MAVFDDRLIKKVNEASRGIDQVRGSLERMMAIAMSCGDRELYDGLRNVGSSLAVLDQTMLDLVSEANRRAQGGG